MAWLARQCPNGWPDTGQDAAVWRGYGLLVSIYTALCHVDVGQSVDGQFLCFELRLGAQIVFGSFNLLKYSSLYL